jgi:hypothetical protein
VPRRSEKRRLLEEYLQQRRPGRLGLEEWNQLKVRLGPISDHHLRRLLRESQAPLAPLVEGVVQSDLAELERTLLALQEEYVCGQERAARALVLEAKQHARWALRRDPAERKAVREEMILWMQTWLENPPLFAEWLKLRKKALGQKEA